MSQPISHGKLWIKICGNTSLADAQVAAEAGADAVGFVFAPSPRRVTPAQVAQIIPHLPTALELIGVFVDASFEEIASTVQACSLTGVQLHYDPPPSLPAQLRHHFGPDLRILRVVHFNAEYARVGKIPGFVSGHDFSRADNEHERVLALAPAPSFSDPNIDAILVDSRTASTAGGTGVAYDWIAASKTLFQNPAIKKPLVVAGGLTPDNVAEAIATLRPWGVDVVSGVESTPGNKDHDKVKDFVFRARAAERE